MRLYAAIDTNVLVSALLRRDSVPGAVVEHALVGRVVPLVSGEILAEYGAVLRGEKFPFAEEDIRAIIDGFARRGLHLEPEPVADALPDAEDAVFYGITLAARKQGDARLVTGNIRHFPRRPYIVTPREMLDILENDGTSGRDGREGNLP